jgi:hypothetical protein
MDFITAVRVSAALEAKGSIAPCEEQQKSPGRQTISRKRPIVGRCGSFSLPWRSIAGLDKLRAIINVPRRSTAISCKKVPGKKKGG